MDYVELFLTASSRQVTLMWYMHLTSLWHKAPKKKKNYNCNTTLTCRHIFLFKGSVTWLVPDCKKWNKYFMALLETWTSSLGLLSLSLLLGSSGISFRPLLTRVEMLLSSQATIALVGLKLHVEADSRTTSGGYITHTQSPIISCEKIRWEVEILIHTFATDHKEFTICELPPPSSPSSTTSVHSFSFLWLLLSITTR